MKNNILIFTATYNEIENIKEFIDEINKLNHKLDILIIDDNSPDGTGNLISKISSSKIFNSSVINLSAATKVCFLIYPSGT